LLGYALLHRGWSLMALGQPQETATGPLLKTGASKFKFVNDLADLFRAGQHPAKPTHRFGFETLVMLGVGESGRPAVSATLVKEVHL